MVLRIRQCEEMTDTGLDYSRKKNKIEVMIQEDDKNDDIPQFDDDENDQPTDLSMKKISN